MRARIPDRLSTDTGTRPPNQGVSISADHTRLLFEKLAVPAIEQEPCPSPCFLKNVILLGNLKIPPRRTGEVERHGVLFRHTMADFRGVSVF
jgi:hypothetical protein